MVVTGSWGQSLEEVLFRKQAELRRLRFGPLESSLHHPFVAVSTNIGGREKEPHPKAGQSSFHPQSGRRKQVLPKASLGMDSGCDCEVAYDFPS